MASPIPLVDLATQYRAIKPEIDAALQRVLASGQFILGPEVEALEREIAAYCKTAHAIAVASGTDALELSLRALDIGPGDEVVTSAFSFIATAEAIIAVGATPVFVDIHPESYTLDPAALRAALSAKTKAIIPVHLYGQPCDMDAVMVAARAHRVHVVEDCAQAIGAAYRGRRVGSFGEAAALSFYPSKNLGACGDAGMILTNDSALAEKFRLLRAHGSRERYHHVVLGTNSRLDELQAALLRVKLHHLDAWTEARQDCARAYHQAFHEAGVQGLVLPATLAERTHVYHLYTIRTPYRRRIQERLQQQGIATQVAYPSTLPQQPALAPYLPSTGSYPQAESAARDVLSLPIYPELSLADIRRIVEEVVRSLA